MLQPGHGATELHDLQRGRQALRTLQAVVARDSQPGHGSACAHRHVVQPQSKHHAGTSSSGHNFGDDPEIRAAGSDVIVHAPSELLPSC